MSRTKAFIQIASEPAFPYWDVIIHVYLRENANQRKPTDTH